MSSEEYAQTVFTDVIAEHLALRQRNAHLEEQMPLRDYLPTDYVRVVEPAAGTIPPQARQWFDLEDDGALDWAA